MGRLRDSQVAAWDAAEPIQTCARCGCVGRKSDVQPQVWNLAEYRRAPSAYCVPCISASNAEARAARKAALAAAPRCCVPSCGMRANLTHNGTGICGRHFKRARATVERRAVDSGFACFGLFGGPTLLSRAALIEAARLGRGG